MAQQAQSICVTCGFTGCDIRIKSCANGCSYHARCLDLMAMTRQSPPSAAPELAEIKMCPCCSSPATGLEMIPLSFTEVDHAQRLSGYNKSNRGGSGDSSISAPAGKRMHIELMNSSSDPTQHHQSSFYDPASPRTGKWSDEEIAFRDSLVPHFVDGSLPLPSGLKLIEFLSSMLKSKPSRLTKKMKHAKLSTRHFHLDAGCIRAPDRSKEVSRLESSFVHSISDPVERSEIKFHMMREWRDHLAERLTYLRISFDAEEWLKSVDVMDRRMTLSKSRNRMVKRRFMMGKAMEKDTSSPTPGIFIDESRSQDDVDFELLASALMTNDAEDADLRALYSSLASDAPHVPASAAAASRAQEVSVDGSSRSRGSTSHGSRGSRSSPVAHASALASSTPAFRSALLPGLGSSEGPNFRFAAPFLAKITAYIEHNRVPFEHIDIWVPSSSSGHPVLDPTGATAPEPTVLGSGSNPNQPVGRLCFAGSASVGVQVMSDNEAELVSPGASQAFDHRSKPGRMVVPLTSDEIYHMSLFGSYSEKFSFSSGCGLPGRVFESAVPAWEQFIANAPSHLFERRGGAMQFGIKTALGLPIKSPNVGRIVLVLYSKHNREKDDELVAQMVRDLQSLNPCPRWKLMVDMGNNAGQPPPSAPLVNRVGQQMVVDNSVNEPVPTGLSEKNVHISNLISLLGENMPSDPSTPLGQQIHNIMSLRLVLLRTNRSPDDELLVDSIITLFDSYVTAGRSRPDITLMLARDFAFHSIQHHQQPMHTNQPPFQRQTSVPTMHHLSIGTSVMQHQQHQEQASCQLDHTHHGQQGRSQSFSLAESGHCSNSDLHVDPKQGNNLHKSQSAMAMNRSQSNTSMDHGQPSNASFSSLTERNYSNPDFQGGAQISPRSSASLSRLERKHHAPQLSEPPETLHS